jgi:hypothetical protein
MKGLCHDLDPFARLARPCARVHRGVSDFNSVRPYSTLFYSTHTKNIL